MIVEGADEKTALRIMAMLAPLDEDARLCTVALVAKMVIERPDFLLLVAEKMKR